MIGRAIERGFVVTSLAVALVVSACGGTEDGGAVGAWTHPEEGTIVLESGGAGSITQSSDPVEFTWTQDGATIELSLDGDEVDAEAQLDGDELTFRAGDFSGDDPVTFTRSP